MIYVYALCPSPPQPLSLPEGIAHDEVDLVIVGQLGAIAEAEIDIAQVKEDDAKLMDAVLAHDRVLGHMFPQTPLLPLRFGTQFKDEAALESFLESHETTYRDRLNSLQDKAEYLLKLSPKSLEMPEIDPDLKGREYFLEKKRRLQAHTEALHQQGDELQAFLIALEQEKIPYVQSAPQDGEERLHILLTRDADRTQGLIQAWQKGLSTWQVVCSEPLPPYHFAA
jgi:hypothetical protein